MRVSFLVVLLVVSCALVVEGRTIAWNKTGIRERISKCQGELDHCEKVKLKLYEKVENLMTKIDDRNFDIFTSVSTRQYLETDIAQLKYQLENPGAEKRFVAIPIPRYAGGMKQEPHLISVNCGERLSFCSERVSSSLKEITTLRGISDEANRTMKNYKLKIMELIETKKQLKEQLEKRKQNTISSLI